MAPLMHVCISACAVLVMLAAQPAASAGDADVVAQARRPLELPGELSDRLRVRTLFVNDSENAQRALIQTAALSDRRRLLGLAARLLHQGGPMKVLPAEPEPSTVGWEACDAELRAAVLRELRYTAPAAGSAEAAELVAIYTAYLAQVGEAGLMLSCMVNLQALDAAAAVRLSARLADPTAADALPGASDRRLRRAALRALVEQVGADAEAVRGPLRHALIERDGPERLRAVLLLQPGQQPAVVAEAVHLLSRQKALSDLDRASLVTLAGLCQGQRDLAADLAQLALQGDRAVASAAATAFYHTPGAGDAVTTTQLDDLAERAAQTRDLAMQHALVGLLLGVAPARLQAGAAGLDQRSPWVALAAHRLALRAWASEHRPAPAHGSSPGNPSSP